MSENPGFEEPRIIWDRRYARLQAQGGRTSPYEPWLGRWRPLLPFGSRILDLGCGAGYDACWLSAAGYMVVGGDFSMAALKLAQRADPSVRWLQLDLRQGLPFAPNAFAGVVANLCLHYFPRIETVAILRQVCQCLRPGGTLLARFNSSDDPGCAAEQRPSDEPGTRWKDGVFKRYFNRQSLEELFAGEWRVWSLEEMTIHHYGAPKMLWEVAAIRQ